MYKYILNRYIFQNFKRSDITLHANSKIDKSIGYLFEFDDTLKESYQNESIKKTDF